MRPVTKSDLFVVVFELTAQAMLNCIFFDDRLMPISKIALLGMLLHPPPPPPKLNSASLGNKGVNEMYFKE